MQLKKASHVWSSLSRKERTPFWKKRKDEFKKLKDQLKISEKTKDDVVNKQIK